MSMNKLEECAEKKVDQPGPRPKKYLPKTEKKIIKPADICTTLRLPTRVNAKRPAFSL